jgi:hypothetical protein
MILLCYFPAAINAIIAVNMLYQEEKEYADNKYNPVAMLAIPAT